MNRRDNLGNTALSLALDDNYDLGVLEALLAQPDLDVNAPDLTTGYTAIMTAVRKNRTAAVKLLVERKGTDVTLVNRASDTPLIVAVKYGNLESLRLLLTRTDLDVNAVDVGHYTALMRACNIPRPNMVEALLGRKDIRVNMRTAASADSAIMVKDNLASWMSALNDAIFFQAALEGLQRTRSVVPLLLRHPDIDVNLVNFESGLTPLMIAAGAGEVETVRALLANYKIRVNDRNPLDRGLTAIRYAAAGNRLEAARVLLARDDLDVNTVGTLGVTPLARAVELNFTSMVTMLLDSEGHVVNVSTADFVNGSTPLHHAASNCNSETLAMILERLDNVSRQDLAGNTPLNIASAGKLHEKSAKIYIMLILNQSRAVHLPPLT